MMGNMGFGELIVTLLVAVFAIALPIMLVVWVVRYLRAMSASQRQIAEELRNISSKIKDSSRTPGL